MSIFKKIAVRIIPVGLLTFIIVAAIAYQRGVYDITFIERPTADITDTEPVDPDTEPLDTTPIPPETTAPDTTGEEQLPDDPPEISEQTANINAFLASIEATDSMISRGYKITDEVFGSSTQLGLLTPSVTIENTLTKRDKTVLTPVRVADEVYSTYTTNFVETSVMRPAVEMYMDYIVIDNGKTVTLLKNDGSTLVGSFDIEKYQPAYTRDSDDIPQFKTEESSGDKYNTTVTKYYMLDERGKLIESDYNDAIEGRGLYFNYPSSYGKPAATYKVFHQNGRYGLGRTYCSTGYQFTKAYNYSDGYACVVNAQGMMYFLNTQFRANVVLSSWRWGTWYTNESGRRVYPHYRAPDSNGIESLGYYYFDHGLIRIRKAEFDGYAYDGSALKEVWPMQIHYTSDEEIVIGTDGKEFFIPSHYRVISYSDGVFLLERDGLYGFYDYSGKWIAQPVYSAAKPFNEGLAAVEKEGLVGVIDTNGNFVVPMIFDHIESASGGVICAYDDETGWTLLNKMK